MVPTITLLTMFKYDNTIFDKFEVPTGYDRELAMNQILFDNGQLELCYQSPEVMRAAIGMWCKTRAYAWAKRYALTQLDYDPIANTDRNYEHTETGTNTGSRDTTNNETGTETQTAETSGSGSVDNWVDGFDAGRSDSDGSTSDSSSSSSGSTDHSIGQVGSEKTDSSHNVSITEHTWGNIGVTTTQQMMREEWDIVDTVEIYEAISREFKQRFCLMVY